MRTNTGRVDHLDGLRAVAILAVLALHWVSWYVPLFHGGSIGVDVFFVLSGYIITTLLWRSRATYATFLRRRVVRLYPALLGLVVVTTLLYAITPGAAISAVETARRGALSLGQATSVWAALQEGSFWLPALHPFAHTWSLAVEWYFYLLWPLPVLAARRAQWSPGRLARVAVVAALVLYAASLALPPHWFYFGPTARAAELLIGGALALHLLDAPDGPRRPRRAGTASTLALAAVAAYVLLGPASSSVGYRVVGIPLAVVATLVLIVVGNVGLSGRMLTQPWVASLGRHSYSLYLWHLAPFLLLEEVDGPKWALGMGTVLSTAALTVLSYRFLERPFLHGSRALTGSGEAQHPARSERVEQVVGGGPRVMQPNLASDLLTLGGTQRAGGVEIGEELPEGVRGALDHLAGQPVQDVRRDQGPAVGVAIGDQEGHRPVEQ